MYIVYCHFNRLNGKLYFGLSRHSIKKRKQNGYLACHKLQNALNKYGWNAFDSFVVRDGLSKKDACELEKELIKKYHTTENHRGYNIHLGGTTPEVTEEWKNKMREISKRNWKEHPERIEIQSKRMKDYYRTHEPTRSMLGKHHSEDTKRKIGEANKGKKLSNEQYEKLKPLMFKKGQIPLNKGIPMSKEKYEKCKVTMFKPGQKPWNKGIKLTDEQKQKLINAQRKTTKKVLCVETGIVYNKIIDASRESGIADSTISAVCKGKPHYITAGGYHWKYV